MERGGWYTYSSKILPAKPLTLETYYKKQSARKLAYLCVIFYQVYSPNVSGLRYWRSRICFWTHLVLIGYVRTRVTCALGLPCACKGYLRSGVTVRARVTCALGLPCACKGYLRVHSPVWQRRVMISPPFPHKIYPFSGWSVTSLLKWNIWWWTCICEFWLRGVAAVIKIFWRNFSFYNEEPEILVIFSLTLIKKKIRFSSHVMKFRREQLQSHILLTASSYMTKNYLIY